MISVEGLTVEFGVKPLFVDASFVVNDRDRIALVGKNGAGKSTMLKILSGIQKPTSGIVSIPNDTTIGYLPQVMKINDVTTVREETSKAFANVDKVKQRLDRLQKQMEERTDYESTDYMELVERFTTEHERYMMMGVESREAEMERTLMGLGFDRTDFDRPTSEFSGGWRMRIELAKLLLTHPDVLLLDEPTNHLDIESIQWLERFLAQNAHAVILVSHDRAFINNVTNRTLEISCSRIIDYKVKYDEYVKLRAERRAQQLRAYENQQKEIAETKAFIERFRYQATKAVQVQQRIRQLEKIVPIEVDEIDNSALRLKFPPCERSGDFPIICEEVGKEWPATFTPDGKEITHVVFEHANFMVRRGEKVAFVGKNGEGKSTMVKCIMAAYGMPPEECPSGSFYHGNLKVGHNVQIGYFAQNQAQLLDDNITVFQTIDNVARGEIRLKINDILGAFMFGGERSEKYVNVLSGGERSRLAMIRLLLEPVNFLILDEPTNHLDMQSKDVLKEAIKAFDGTVIVVSHDREFLDGLVTKVYEFGGGKVREHLGGIYDYLQYRNAENIESAITASSESLSTKEEASDPKASKLSYAEHKEIQKKAKKLQNQIKECETKIASMEVRITELDALLCNPENASDMQLVTEYTSIKQAIESEEEKYFDLSEQLEALA